MTVRTWFTISAIVLVALAGAVVYQFTRPLAVPEVIVSSGDVRVDGKRVAWCWPQRSGENECTEKSVVVLASTGIPANGSLRLITAYPAQPSGGSIRIEGDDGDVALKTGWKRTLRYDLKPGRYRMEVEARYPSDAYVRYVFGLTLTRSGS